MKLIKVALLQMTGCGNDNGANLATGDFFCRRAAPYSKWFWTFRPYFKRVCCQVHEASHKEILSRAYRIVDRMHNELKITMPLDETVSQYFGRPYLFMSEERFVEEVKTDITNERSKRSRTILAQSVNP